ncbi:hypothetical protein DSCW_54310 [Desulfosarcina widdelii]|uniref:Uncharacterized protein n=1 Tax=Desulfosarcina widdelii TaxID=947919 RepID=A0A5K7ZI54_9BACT|nr:hypothetical protein [Desulfosarcina widdelii]BBO78014.1 hypothetical protein DSCW_54310 [Desulfosarcina widdelii]
MPRSVEICQFVARAINHTTWNVPKIRDGDGRWRNINNSHLVENQHRINGHDHYEDAIFRAKRIMEQRGWITEISDSKQPCHEHLYYQHYRLRCWK